MVVIYVLSAGTVLMFAHEDLRRVLRGSLASGGKLSISGQGLAQVHDLGFKTPPVTGELCAPSHA